MIDTVIPTVADIHGSVDFKSINDSHQTLISTMKDKYRGSSSKYTLINKLMMLLASNGVADNGGGFNLNDSNCVNKSFAEELNRFSQMQMQNSAEFGNFGNIEKISCKLDDTMIMSKLPDFGNTNEYSNTKDNQFINNLQHKNSHNISMDLKDDQAKRMSIPNDINEVLRMSKERKCKLRASHHSNDVNISKDSSMNSSQNQDNKVISKNSSQSDVQKNETRKFIDFLSSSEIKKQDSYNELKEKIKSSNRHSSNRDDLMETFKNQSFRPK